MSTLIESESQPPLAVIGRVKSVGNREHLIELVYCRQADYDVARVQEHCRAQGYRVIGTWLNVSWDELQLLDEHVGDDALDVGFSELRRTLIEGINIILQQSREGERGFSEA